MESKQFKRERLATLADRRDKANRDFAMSVERALNSLQNTLARIEEQEADVAGHTDELVVLVRITPGAPVKVYHSSDRPCGRVDGLSRSRSSFKKYFEGEAQVRGLTRCSACSFPRVAAA